MRPTTLLAIIAAIASSNMAYPNLLNEPDVIERELKPPCYYKNACSFFNAGKCEGHCAKYGKRFTRMDGDKCELPGQKQCCCSRN